MSSDDAAGAGSSSPRPLGTEAEKLRQVRLARNQVLFREVNERVEKVSDFSADGRISFVCECSNADCTEQIELTRSEYERVRGVPTWFAVAPGHGISDIEAVVESTERYETVQKVEAGGRVATVTDPRRPSL